ncbi:stage VI sporulation protein F [Brevibacillus fluminis]|uniref:stage VI sporulation protein F n=1 Tax=Brevibacillus fluminis TaxID=511487 RepID=UPI003F8C6441
MKNITRQLFDKLQGKLPGGMDESQLKNLASGMKKSEFQDEAKLRQMIKTLAAISGTPVTPEKEEKIIQLFRENKFNPNDLSSLKNLLS